MEDQLAAAQQQLAAAQSENKKLKKQKGNQKNSTKRQKLPTGAASGRPGSRMIGSRSPQSRRDDDDSDDEEDGDESFVDTHSQGSQGGSAGTAVVSAGTDAPAVGQVVQFNAQNPLPISVDLGNPNKGSGDYGTVSSTYKNNVWQDYKWGSQRNEREIAEKVLDHMQKKGCIKPKTRNPVQVTRTYWIEMVMYWIGMVMF